MRASYLVCYDITDPKKLARVFRLLKGYGIHLQYSVFQCSMTWPELIKLKEQIANIINPKEDDIRIYPLPSDYKVTVMGRGNRVPDGAELFL